METRQQVEDDLYLTGVSATDKAQIDVKNLAAHVERAGDYQTPCKPGILTKSIKLEEVKLSQFDEVTEISGSLEDEELRDVMTTIGSNWNKMVGTVLSLESTLPTVQKQLVELFGGLAVVVEGVEDKANAIGTVVGQRGELMEAGVTIWDAVEKGFSLGVTAENLARSVTENCVSVDQVVTELDKSFRAHVQEVVQVVGRIHGALSHTKTGHRQMENRLATLEQRASSESLRPPVTAGGDQPSLLAVFADPTSSELDEIEDLRTEVANLRTMVRSAMEVVRPREAGGYPDPTLETHLFHERLQKVEMRATGDSYVTEHRVFASYEDVLNWIRGAKGREEIQLYWDVYSLLSKTRDVTHIYAVRVHGGSAHVRAASPKSSCFTDSSLHADRNAKGGQVWEQSLDR